MRVESLMKKQVATCSPDQSLNDAARIMWESDCGCVPVAARDGQGKLVGMVTDRDVCMTAYFRGISLKDLRVEEAMSTPVRSCRPGDTVAEAEETMREAQVRRLPVVDDAGQLVGLVSLADLAAAAAQTRRSRKKGITEREVGETLAAICRTRQLDAPRRERRSARGKPATRSSG